MVDVAALVDVAAFNALDMILGGDQETLLLLVGLIIVACDDFGFGICDSHCSVESGS